jgi:hypothetical protein
MTVEILLTFLKYVMEKKLSGKHVAVPDHFDSDPALNVDSAPGPDSTP